MGGHGHGGETCCMCSYQYGGPTGTVVVYAAEDYDNYWGGHNAFWHCEHECERKCGGPHAGGHKFGFGRRSLAVSLEDAQVDQRFSDGAPAQIWQPVLSHHGFDSSEAEHRTDTHSFSDGVAWPYSLAVQAHVAVSA